LPPCAIGRSWGVECFRAAELLARSRHTGHLRTPVLRRCRRRMVSLRRPKLPRHVLAGRLRSGEWMCLRSGDGGRRVGVLRPSSLGRTGGVAVRLAVEHTRTGHPWHRFVRQASMQTAWACYSWDRARQVTAPVARSGDDTRGGRNEARSPSRHRRTLEFEFCRARPGSGIEFDRFLRAAASPPLTLCEGQRWFVSLAEIT
jgi:hypothetical protein